MVAEDLACPLPELGPEGCSPGLRTERVTDRKINIAPVGVGNTITATHTCEQPSRKVGAAMMTTSTDYWNAHPQGFAHTCDAAAGKGVEHQIESGHLSEALLLVFGVDDG